MQKQSNPYNHGKRTLNGDDDDDDDSQLHESLTLHHEQLHNLSSIL